ncbi:MAG: arginase [Deinococcota bacterium]
MASIHILGVPMDLGAGRRGVDMGPSALRLAKLADHLQEIGHTIKDLGNVAVDVPESLEVARGLHYVGSIASSCLRTYDVLRTLPWDVFPLVLGGDHSMSMGTVAGVAGRGRTGVLWIDAHADANTPTTSPSGNVHGMPLAHLLGYGDPRLLSIWGGQAVVRPEDIVYIGLRSIDQDERAFIRKHKLRAYTMKEIDKLGMARVTEEAIAQLSHVERLHVSFDADALDPSVAPGVGTPVAGGLSYREAHLLMEMLAEANVVTSLDLVEVNPILDTGNSTATIMVEMAASLLGKTIL